MTMSLKPTPRSTFFAPKSVVTAVTAALMALSSSAMAVQTQPKPVDKLQQLINTSESNQKAAAAKSMAMAQDAGDVDSTSATAGRSTQQDINGIRQAEPSAR